MTMWNTPADQPAKRDPAGGPAQGPRWHGDTLDLTGGVRATDPEGWGEGGGPELEAGLIGIVEAIDQLLAHPEVRVRPVIVARLVQARARVRAARGVVTTPVTQPASAATATAAASAMEPGSSALAADGGRVEAGHFLG